MTSRRLQGNPTCSGPLAVDEMVRTIPHKELASKKLARRLPKLLDEEMK
jgi:hypothetical protein